MADYEYGDKRRMTVELNEIGPLCPRCKIGHFLRMNSWTDDIKCPACGCSPLDLFKKNETQVEK